MEKKASLKTRLRQALDAREKRAADLVNDLKIPKSAISQYLSGKSQNMESGRLFSICRYLDVSEAWLMGYDVPMENKKNSHEQIELSAGEELLLSLFRAIPEQRQEMVLQMIRVALGKNKE